MGRVEHSAVLFCVEGMAQPGVHDTAEDLSHLSYGCC